MKNIFLILFTLLVTQVQAQKFEGLAVTSSTFRR